MKHSIFLAAAACTLAATLISCASSKGVAADAYDTEEEQVTQISVNPTQKKLDGDHYSPEKLNGSNRSFGQKLFNLNKYTKIDNFTQSQHWVDSVPAREASSTAKERT